MWLGLSFYLSKSGLVRELSFWEWGVLKVTKAGQRDSNNQLQIDLVPCMPSKRKIFIIDISKLV